MLPSTDVILTFAAALLALIGPCNAGCFEPDQEPIERLGNRMIDDVLKPAVEKGGEELTTRAGQLTGQVSAIEPGYEVTGFGGLFNGVIWNLRVKVVGLSANLAGSTQSDRGKGEYDVPPPAIRNPETQIAGP